MNEFQLTVAMAVAKESELESVKKTSLHYKTCCIVFLTMASDHIWLLRRPLPPKKPPPIVMSCPGPRPAGGLKPFLLLHQGAAAATGLTASSRQEDDIPAPRAAPPTPLLPDTPAPLMGRATQGFPCKPPRPRAKNPLLELLQSDQRFRVPPPTFCLSDFLHSHNGSQHNSQSTPV